MNDVTQANGQPNATGHMPMGSQLEPIQQTLAMGHQENQNPQHKCPHPPCHNKSFRGKGNLDRHIREAHGSEMFICPVLSCPRNKNGFSRKYNLIDHQKRRHKRGSEQGLNNLRASRHGSDTSGSRENEEMANELGLQLRLEFLRAKRAEIDEDIRLLENALRSMNKVY